MVRGAGGGRGGMTLVEITFAFGILLGGILVLGQNIAGSMTVSRDALERSSARRMAEDRLSELRTTLHTQDWTAPTFNQGVHDTQFNALLAENGTSRTQQLDSATNRLATITVAVTRDEQTAAAYAGLAASNVDLDKDGTEGQAGDRPVPDLVGAGVQITVTWRSAAGRHDEAPRSFRIGTILY